jgi:formylglycine-generating enzyme required for sulfatase activity
MANDAVTPRLNTPNDEQKWALIEQLLRGEIGQERVCAEHALSHSELEEWLRDYRRAARRALDDEMAAALSARGLGFDPTPSSEFSGSVEGMALAELIQTLHYGRKDAMIRVEHDGQQSFLWCTDGEIIDARSGGLSGNAAVHRLLALRHGRFQADFAPVVREPQIDTSTQALLLESAKHFDECRPIRDQLGDTRALYVPSERPLESAELDADEQELLAAFAPGRSIDQVVSVSRWPDLEALERVARLVEQKFLTLEPHVGSERQASPAISSPRPSVELSVRPLAASLGARVPGPSSRGLPRWASAVAGAVVVSAAFAVGYWSARRSASAARASAAIRISLPEAEPSRACPRGMALIHGGPSFAAAAGGEFGVTSPVSVRSPELASYCIERGEVSVADFAACVASGTCSPPLPEPLPRAAKPVSVGEPGLRCNASLPGREREPINCISFAQAERYCAWRGARLPTEAEWLRAAAVGAELTLAPGLAEWTSDRVGYRPELAGASAASGDLQVVLGGAREAFEGTALVRPVRTAMPASASARRIGFRCATHAVVSG